MSSLPPVNPMNGPLDWDDALYQADHRNRYADADVDEPYQEHEIAYRYGHDAARRDDLRDSDWDASAAGLKAMWEEHHPDRPWERFKESVRHAWNRVRGRDDG